MMVEHPDSRPDPSQPYGIREAIEDAYTRQREGNELPPRLRCSGGELLKPNGQPIILRGVSFGSWGEDSGDDAPQVKALGANCVRIALRWWGRHGSNPEDVDSRDNDGVAFLKRENVAKWLDMITACSAAGMWVIPFIDSNCGQSGTQDAETRAWCDKKGSFGARGRNFLTDPSMRHTFAQVVWRAAAARLRPIARIALLELQPEMMEGRPPEVAAAVRDFYREVIDAVRQVDADTPFLIGPRDGYNINLVAEAVLPERSDVVYTGNQLSGRVTNAQKFDAGLADLTRLREDTGAPVHIQQLGRKTGDDPTLTHMRYALERTHEEKIGSNWWQWKQNTANPNEYGLNFKTADGRGWIAKEDELALLAEHWGAA